MDSREHEQEMAKLCAEEARQKKLLEKEKASYIFVCIEFYTSKKNQFFQLNVKYSAFKKMNRL